MVSDTTCRDNDVYPGTEYYYILYVYDDNEFYRASNIRSVVSIDENPNSVYISQASDPEETSISIEWTKNDNIDFGCYKIYRSTNEGMGVSGILLDSVTEINTNIYTDDGLEPNTTYFYNVAVYDQANNYALGNECVITTLPIEPTSVELENASNVEDSSICIRWSLNNNNDFNYYRLCRSLYPNITVTSPTYSIHYNRHDTLYCDHEIDISKQYYYKVFVYDDDGNYSGSNEITAKYSEGMAIVFTNGVYEIDGDSLLWSNLLMNLNITFDINNHNANIMDYDLLIVDDYDWCSLEKLTILNSYLDSGGCVILTSGTPLHFGNSTELNSIIGATDYSNASGNIIVEDEMPFGLDYYSGQNIGYLPPNNHACMSGLSDSTFARVAWESGAYNSFAYKYDNRRSYYTSTPFANESTIEILKAAILWMVYDN